MIVRQIRQIRMDYDTLKNQDRLDAGETALFLRELEDIDKQAYMRRFPALIARQVIPTFISVAAWAHSYTWREWTPNGAAKFIQNASDDLPMVDVTGKENSQIIKDCGAGYMYTLKEVKAFTQTGVPLDSMRAQTARQSTEQLIDQTLARGASAEGLFGVLNLDSTAIVAANRVATVTPSTKAAGGTAWGTLLAPKATGREVANDVIGMAAKIVSDSNGIFSSVNIVMPIDQYNYASETQINALQTTTALEVMLKSQFITSVRPWYQCKGAGAAGADRIAAFPSDPNVLGGIVPQEWTPQAPQQRNLAFIVNALASCGGVVCRYPLGVRYMDGT